MPRGKRRVSQGDGHPARLPVFPVRVKLKISSSKLLEEYGNQKKATLVLVVEAAQKMFKSHWKSH